MLERTRRSVAWAGAGRWAFALSASCTLALPRPASALQKAPEPAKVAPAPAANAPLPVAPSGKSLVIPDDIKAKGKVFYSQPGNDRQVRFVSDAPFEKINGHSNGVIGFAIAGPDSDPAKLQAGEWHMPVASLQTGSQTRDSHLVGPEWLDAAKYPDIVFKLKQVNDTKEQRGAEDPALKSYSATLVGDMTIHGVTKELTIPATVRFRPASAHSGKAIAEGDFLLIACKFQVTLADFGVKHEMIVTKKKVAESIQLNLSLFMASVPPESQPVRERPARLPSPPAVPPESPAKTEPKKD